MSIFKKIKRRIVRLFCSYEKQARYEGIKMGTCNFINSRFWSTEPYLITIGSHVQITKGVQLHTHGGGISVHKIVPKFDCLGKVVIEDWAYIGSFSQIMPGVTIGEGSLVAAGSVVTKSTPPGSVVGGNPAKIICTVENYLHRNKKYDTKTKGLSAEEKKRVLLALPEDMFLKK